MLELNTIIEFASYSDVAEIARFSRDFIEQGLGWSWNSARVRKAMRDRCSNVVVAKRGQQLVGIGIMKYADNSANLDLLAVKPKYRRLGIATTIIKWHELVVSTAGIACIHIQVRQGNVGAIGLYANLGYVEVKRVPDFYGYRETAVMMFKHMGIKPRLRDFSIKASENF
jgi:ribosomal-protein-alanine N-acetyltransferase